MKNLSKIVFFFFAVDFLSASLHFHSILYLLDRSPNNKSPRELKT